MDLGTAMIVIAGIGAYYSLRSQRLRQRGDARDSRASEAALPGPREAELEKEVESLRERIHVLERIATDNRRPQALAEEIESLRDR